MLCIWIEMYVYTKSQHAQNDTNLCCFTAPIAIS